MGNQSTTEVGQTCVGFVPVAGHRDAGVKRLHAAPKGGVLARTGVEAPDLALMAAALLFGGTMMVVPARRRRLAASTAPADAGPVAG